MINYENVPEFALPVFGITPDLCLGKDFNHVVQEIAPKVTFSKEFECEKNDVDMCVPSFFLSAKKELCKEIEKVANSFIDVGMEIVIVSVYPSLVMGNGTKMVLVQDVCISAFRNSQSFKDAQGSLFGLFYV